MSAPRPRDGLQAQLDVLLGLRRALIEQLSTAPDPLVPGLAVAIEIVTGTVQGLDELR